MWIEMSRDEEHGGSGWGFRECLWAPSRKKNGSRWNFWQLVREVRRGDVVVHLRGKTGRAAFVGFSVADADGAETSSRPPQPKDWGFAETFYRVALSGYEAFPEPLQLKAVFQERETELRLHFQTNRLQKRVNKEKLFYVIQKNRLQCLNGAYLSECSDRLAAILFDRPFSTEEFLSLDVGAITTGERITRMRQRVGQQRFSERVKRNYGNRCCYPDCPVTDLDFLVGAHIARWADEPGLRGEPANGVCLCVFHDRAFELGLFTIDEKLTVVVHHESAQLHPWAVSVLARSEGQPLKSALVPPSPGILELHRKRIGFEKWVRDLDAKKEQ